jgi:GNAT superfamily N-acetyltransferase
MAQHGGTDKRHIQWPTVSKPLQFNVHLPSFHFSMYMGDRKTVPINVHTMGTGRPSVDVLIRAAHKVHVPPDEHTISATAHEERKKNVGNSVSTTAVLATSMRPFPLPDGGNETPVQLSKKNPNYSTARTTMCPSPPSSTNERVNRDARILLHTATGRKVSPCYLAPVDHVEATVGGSALHPHVAAVLEENVAHGDAAGDATLLHLHTLWKKALTENTQRVPIVLVARATHNTVLQPGRDGHNPDTHDPSTHLMGVLFGWIAPDDDVVAAMHIHSLFTAPTLRRRSTAKLLLYYAPRVALGLNVLTLRVCVRENVLAIPGAVEATALQSLLTQAGFYTHIRTTNQKHEPTEAPCIVEVSGVLVLVVRTVLVGGASLLNALPEVVEQMVDLALDSSGHNQRSRPDVRAGLLHELGSACPSANSSSRESPTHDTVVTLATLLSSDPDFENVARLVREVYAKLGPSAQPCVLDKDYQTARNQLQEHIALPSISFTEDNATNTDEPDIATAKCITQGGRLVAFAVALVSQGEASDDPRPLSSAATTTTITTTTTTTQREHSDPHMNILLSHLYVKPTMQRLGIGTTISRETFVKLAKTYGQSFSTVQAKVLTHDTHVGNGGQKLFQALGFVNSTGPDTTAWAGVNTVVMSTVLNSALFPNGWGLDAHEHNSKVCITGGSFGTKRKTTGTQTATSVHKAQATAYLSCPLVSPLHTASAFLSKHTLGHGLAHARKGKNDPHAAASTTRDAFWKKMLAVVGSVNAKKTTPTTPAPRKHDILKQGKTALLRETTRSKAVSEHGPVYEHERGSESESESEFEPEHGHESEHASEHASESESESESEHEHEHKHESDYTFKLDPDADSSESTPGVVSSPKVALPFVRRAPHHLRLALRLATIVLDSKDCPSVHKKGTTFHHKLMQERDTILDMISATHGTALFLVHKDMVGMAIAKATSVKEVFAVPQRNHDDLIESSISFPGYDPSTDDVANIIAFCIVSQRYKSSTTVHREEHYRVLPARKNLGEYASGALYVSRFHAMSEYRQVVLEHSAGHGIGHFLLTFVVATALSAKDPAARCVVLDVDQKNTARAFYAKHLFQDTGFVKSAEGFFQYEMMLNLGLAPTCVATGAVNLLASFLKFVTVSKERCRLKWYTNSENVVARQQYMDTVTQECLCRAQEALVDPNSRLLLFLTNPLCGPVLPMPQHDWQYAPVLGMAVTRPNLPPVLQANPAVSVSADVASLVHHTNASLITTEEALYAAARQYKIRTKVTSV